MLKSVLGMNKIQGERPNHMASHLRQRSIYSVWLPSRVDYSVSPGSTDDLQRIPCVSPPVTGMHAKIGRND
jgi:hypothetical protein